jgi:hypothetical protein
LVLGQSLDGFFHYPGLVTNSSGYTEAMSLPRRLNLKYALPAAVFFFALAVTCAMARRNVMSLLQQ